MSLKSFLPRSWRLTIFGALVLAAAAIFPGPAQPQAMDTENGGGNAVVSGSKEVRPALWRSFIWENLPTENSGGPGPDPISLAYQQNDWRPIFIDSQFELNPGATLILEYLRNLENQAIDPRPFRLNELSQSIEKLAQSLSVLKRADPDLQDFKAESLSSGHPTEPAAPTGIKPAGWTAGPMDPAELLKKYEDTFRAASETDIRLTAAFFLFAREMNPFLQEEEYLKASSGEIPISEFLRELKPKTFNYDALISAYGRYKTLAAQGNQQHVGMPSTVRSGESGNNIRDLQKRLLQEGFFSASITGVYDAQTERAVKDFQAAHLIEPDGAVGQADLAMAKRLVSG